MEAGHPAGLRSEDVCWHAHAFVLSCGNASQISDLPSREVVPGDVVEMHVGDRVPADTRIIALKTATLRAEQASLTGESVAVLKSVEAVQEEGCELQAKVRTPVTVSPLAFTVMVTRSLCSSVPSRASGDATVSFGIAYCSGCWSAVYC